MLTRADMELQLSLERLFWLAIKNTHADTLLAEETLKGIPPDNLGLGFILLAATLHGNTALALQLMPLAGAGKMLPKILRLLQQENIYLNTRDRRAIIQALTDVISGKMSVIPENILRLIQEKNPYLSASDRAKLYQKVIDVLVEKADLTFDNDIKGELQNALDFMIQTKEETHFPRLIESNLYTHVNGASLLSTALNRSHWNAIVSIIQRGNVSNIASIFLGIQQGQPRIRSYISSTQDYENARAAAILYLSNNNLPEHSDTEGRSLQSVLTLIIQDTPSRFEAVKPVFLVPSNITALNIDELLNIAMQVGHGIAAVFMMEKGAKNIARSLYNLGKQTPFSWVVNQVVSTWKTGSHEETYQAFINKLVTLDAEYFNQNNMDEIKALLLILNDLITKSEHERVRKILGSPCILEHLDSSALFFILIYLLHQLKGFEPEKETEKETEEGTILRNICRKIVLDSNEVQKLVDYILEQDIFMQSNGMFEKNDVMQCSDLRISIILSENNMIKQIKDKLLSAINMPSVFLMNTLLQEQNIDAHLEIRDCSILLGFSITNLGNFALAKICIDKIIIKQQAHNTANTSLPTPLLDGLLVVIFHIKKNNLEDKKNDLQSIKHYLIENLNAYQTDAFEESQANGALLSNLRKMAQYQEYSALIALLELITSKKITIQDGTYDAVLAITIQNPDPLEGVEIKTKIVNIILNDTHNTNHISLKYMSSVPQDLNDWEDVVADEDKVEKIVAKNLNPENDFESNSIDLLTLCTQKRYFGIALSISEYATKYHKAISNPGALNVASHNSNTEMHFAYASSTQDPLKVLEEDKKIEAKFG